MKRLTAPAGEEMVWLAAVALNITVLVCGRKSPPGLSTQFPFTFMFLVPVLALTVAPLLMVIFPAILVVVNPSAEVHLPLNKVEIVT